MLNKKKFKQFVENVAKPISDRIEKSLPNIDGTVSEGVSFNFSPSIWCFSFQLGVSIDMEGNIALQGTISGGLTTGTPGGSIMRYRTITNAPNVKKLNGSGYQLGGSIAAFLFGAGKEVNLIPDQDTNKVYLGSTSLFGLSTPGGEFHVAWGETFTIAESNIFNIIDEIYENVSGW